MDNFDSFLKKEYSRVATKYTFLSSQQIKKRVLVMWKKSSNASKRSTKLTKSGQKKQRPGTKERKTSSFNKEDFGKRKRSITPLNIDILPAPRKSLLKRANGVTSNKLHVSFNNEPEIRYRTASEASSTSTCRKKKDIGVTDTDLTFNHNLETNRKSYLSSRSMKSVKHHKTKSEKSFDDLVTNKCSWSYKALHVMENGSLDSSQGCSSLSYIPSTKKHQDMLNCNSSKMNRIAKKISNQIIENTKANISMKLPSSSESIFDNLLSEADKISRQGKMQNKIDRCINNSRKKKGLRPSKSINYAISSESSSDEEMVLQTRTFNDTNCVDSNNYNSDHNSKCHDDFNQTPNLSNEVVELNDSFTNNEISIEKKGMNSQNFNSEPCSEIPSDKIYCEENLQCNSREMNMINDDILENTAGNKTNQNNLESVKMPSSNNTEMNFDISPTEDKISNLKKNKKTYRSSNNSQTKRNLRTLKPTNYADEMKQYESQTRTSNGTIWENNNDKHFSVSSNESFYQTSFLNLSNDEAEINELCIDTNSDGFSDENKQNEFTMPLPYPTKDESKNFEFELNEIQPQGLYNPKSSQSTDNYFSPKRCSSKKINTDSLNIESTSSPSEQVRHISKISNHESLSTSNKISEKYKDLKKPDIQCGIDEIYFNISSEVQSIGNKTEMTGSLSEDDEITCDFLNGSLDLEKYNLKQYRGSSVYEEQSRPTRESKQIRKELEYTKVVKRKTTKLSKSLPLKEEKVLYTSQNLNYKNTKKKSITFDNCTSDARKVADGKTRTSKYIALRDDFGKQEKMIHATHSRTSSNINQSKVTNKRALNSENHNGQLPKRNQLRKKNSTLEIGKNKNHKGKDLLSDNSYEYCNSTEDNLFDKSMRKLNLQNDTQKAKSLKFQNRYFEENNIYSQSSCSSNSISRNIQTRAKNEIRFGKNNTKEVASRLDYNTNVSTGENSKNNGSKEIYISSSEDDAENKIKSAHLIKKTTKENPQTWEDLDILLNITQFDQDKKLSLTEIRDKGQRTSMNRNRDSCSSSSSSVQNVLDERSDILDVIETTPSRYSFNRNKPEKLIFSEKSLENEKAMRSLVPKSSPNISIIEKTIANMNSYASPYLRPRNDKSQPVRIESSDESNERSPILTEYSYAIQEFKSTIYFTADKGVNTAKETCFASKIEKKSTLHQNEAKFSNTIKKNYKNCMQNKSDAVINSRKIASTSHPVSPKPISTWPTNSSRKINKGATSVRKKQTNTLVPEIKMASNAFTIKNKIGTSEKEVEKSFKSKDLNKKDALKNDSIVSSNEDTDISIESIGFSFKGKIDEKKNYNLRKRKSYKDNKETTKKPKREDTSTELQLCNSVNASNLKTKEMELLRENSTGSESQKNRNDSTLKQRKRKSNIALKDQFALTHENCSTEEISYAKCVLNTTSNLVNSKENEESGSEIECNHREKISNMARIPKDMYDEKGNMYKENENVKKNEDSLIRSGVIISNSKIPPRIRSNAKKNTVSEFVKEMENGSLKPLKENNLHAMSSKEKTQTYDEYQKYLKDLFQDENILQRLENSQFNDTGNSKKGSGLKQKQNFPKPLNKDHVLHCMKEMSDDDVFSISSFGSDSDGNEASQKEETDFLCDL